MLIPALWGTVAALIWIFSSKANSSLDLWWVAFS
ncbi:hypothetical protein MEC_00433 [Bartonella alsatica IBS 382]|uniref:Uncharacterized protein n=1 Tax=Bartonella alsatica IBS 382 TaxID=1094551 RepID=J0YML7_9HYPH|nr:hypothetical protein MEC_00433 [Bartonella alsatica IBS 382]